ncbi:MAG: hypothetical protein KDC43_18755, partial [Saprospiraceae bacterium]|nr:hypothetical protein [Saprospiraceae bacterium]
MDAHCRQFSDLWHPFRETRLHLYYRRSGKTVTFDPSQHPVSSMPNLNAYCQAHSTPLSPILYELERETHLKTLAPQMLSGPLQGQLLRLLSLMIRPRAVLEIGT